MWDAGNAAGVKHTLRMDITAGFLVFLIALPLCLGIALASNFPPVAGLLTAIIGGIIATFFGSAPLTIKGPAAGLIVIASGAVQELGQGNLLKGYHRALAAIVVSGVIQIGFAFARAGMLGDLFPSSVVHGMLAAIGVIILARQTHVLMGVKPFSKEPLELLREIPHSLSEANPEVLAIGFLSLLLLFGIPRMRAPWVKRIPVPMLVLLVSLPLGRFFDLSHEHTYTFHKHLYAVGPTFLVQVPAHLLSAITFPDFSHFSDPLFFKYVAMFALVGSIESLLSAQAIYLLDPEKRPADLNRDLLSVGVGNVICGFIGGLPMISEIVRSTANLSYGARTRHANFFHGVFLLIFAAFLPGLLQQIPLAALAAMLIYTGVRLASPLQLAHVFRTGTGHLVAFIVTWITTLAIDLLAGVAVGFLVNILLARGKKIRTSMASKTK